MLGWTQDQFWNGTFYELSCAYVGYCKREGVGRFKVHEDGWSGASIDAHIAAVEELKKQYPDGPRPRKTKAQKRHG